MNKEESPQGFLILPHVRVQNANAISSPLTHGFPSMTAFLGLMWALDRKMAEADIRLVPNRVGVICHGYSEQVKRGYVDTFRLTRNPLDKSGNPAAIVEEGRIHLNITLIFEVSGGYKDDKDNLLFQGDIVQRRRVAWKARELLETMRVAGGTVLPVVSIPGKRVAPQLVTWPETEEAQARRFQELRRAWLPGFALVGRDDLLQQRLKELREDDVGATLLDAWLELSRFNYRSHLDEERGTVAWKVERERGSGWVVPIPIGYVGLSPLYEGGEVFNARDQSTPFRFVETIYSMGQWIGPHRLKNIKDLLWEGETQADEGLYLCKSFYSSQTTEGNVATAFD